MSDSRPRPATNSDLAGSSAATSRIDLHLHSLASGAATNWWVKSLGLGGETRESYTEPAAAAAMVRSAGMDFVTLTDHETIDGALQLAGRPDFIVGEEINAVFPEDRTTVDVLIYGLSPSDHDELQARRDDVYRLVDYLRESNLVYVLAHPVFEPGARLDRAAIERRMVLFPLWELINGSRPAEQNRLTAELAATVDALDLRQIAQRHELHAPTHRRIAGTGGSDDHGGIYGGATWTTLPRVTSASDLLTALRDGEVWPGGEDGSVAKMASTGFKIAGLASVERGEPAHQASGPAAKLIESLPLLSVFSGAQVRRAITSRYETWVEETLGQGGQGLPVIGALARIGSLVEAHLLLAPYLGVHGYFGRERQKTRDLRQALRVPSSEPVRVGLFVDDLGEVHGVSTFYRHIAALAESHRDLEVTLVGCGNAPGAATLKPIASVPMPLYGGRSLAVPSLLDALDLMAERRFDIVHVAAPGPLGITAAIASMARGLPVVGAYHTELGDYARQLSGDALVGDVVETLVRWFYERCAAVTVPSNATAAALRNRGYQIDPMDVIRHGVDSDLFNPGRRDEALHDALGKGRTLILYVGRVSQEKGLDRFAEDYLGLRSRRDDTHLVVVGDGPFREEMAAMLGDAATFTGFLHDEDLARYIASADIFAFPSQTDTLGLVVLEAQACGLPAVVFGRGGPSEGIRPNISGLVAPADDSAAFIAASQTWELVFDSLAGLYREIARGDRPADREARPAIPPVFASMLGQAAPV
jgi:glycosyltransferase involved in cell wall biosynthesis/predicted metal-dependent phosphoesterase TrpH